MKVLVLLASHNGNRYIRQQLESIWAQEGVDVDILVNDDDSSDGTWESLAKAALGDPRLRILEPRIRCGSAGRNFFRLLAQFEIGDAEFVALSDQDDIWFRRKLQRAVRSIRERGVDGYSSNVEAFWPDGRRRLTRKDGAQVKYDHFLEAAGPGCTYIVTKELASELQSFIRSHPEIPDRMIRHDWFVYAFARSQGYRWYIDEPPSMLYRQHEGNVVGVNHGWRSVKERLRMLRSGAAREQVVLLLKVLPRPDWIAAGFQRFGIRDRWRLACASRELRRRRLDQWFLKILLFVMK